MLTKTTKQSDCRGVGIDNGYTVIGHGADKGLIVKCLNFERGSSEIVLEIIEVTQDVSETKPRIENTFLTILVSKKTHNNSGVVSDFEVEISTSKPLTISCPELNIKGDLKVNGTKMIVP